MGNRAAFILVIVAAIITLLVAYVVISAFQEKPQRSTTCICNEFLLTAPDGGHCFIEDDGTLELSIMGNPAKITGLECTENNLTLENVNEIDIPVNLETYQSSPVPLASRSINQLKCTYANGTLMNATSMRNPYVYIRYISLQSNITRLSRCQYSHVVSGG